MSGRNGKPYAGVTSDLIKRVYQHKRHVIAGFTGRYQVDGLVWFELHAAMESAIGREKAMKRWRRTWKVKLVEESNPQWRDRYPGLV